MCQVSLCRFDATAVCSNTQIMLFSLRTTTTYAALASGILEVVTVAKVCS